MPGPYDESGYGDAHVNQHGLPVILTGCRSGCAVTTVVPQYVYIMEMGITSSTLRTPMPCKQPSTTQSTHALELILCFQITANAATAHTVAPTAM